MGCLLFNYICEKLLIFTSDNSVPWCLITPVGFSQPSQHDQPFDRVLPWFLHANFPGDYCDSPEVSAWQIWPNAVFCCHVHTFCCKEIIKIYFCKLVHKIWIWSWVGSQSDILAVLKQGTKNKAVTEIPFLAKRYKLLWKWNPSKNERNP